MPPPDPPPALDGATTALQRRIEELTAELERSRYKGCGSYPRAIGEIEAALGITGEVPLSETVDAVRKLREYAAACEKTAGLNQQENVQLKLDLATERAAREQAEAERDAARRVSAAAEEHLEQHRREDPHELSELRHELWQRDSECKALSQGKHQAERERDAALARVKELEADRHEYVVKLDALREQIHEQAIAGREDGKLIAELKDDSRRSDSLRVAEVAAARIAQQAAETALASARELLGQALTVLVHWNNYQAEEGRSYIPEDENAAVLLRVQAWLSSNPAPVAAPCAGCAAARDRIKGAIGALDKSACPATVEWLEAWLKEHP